MCALPFACLSTAEGKAIRQGAAAWSFLGKAEPFPSRRLSSALLSCGRVPARPSQCCLWGGHGKVGMEVLQRPFFCMGKERSVWYRNNYRKVERRTEVIPDECCCSASYDICHCCGWLSNSCGWLPAAEVAVTLCLLGYETAPSLPILSRWSVATDRKPHSFVNPDLNITLGQSD